MARPQPISERPRRLGHFEVIEEIGQGGMGVVFLARQPTLDRRVVLKRIRRELSKDPVAVERFHLEARAAAAVHHQNVVTVYDCFSYRGDAFIAQEWVAGIDVAELIARVGAVEPLMAARVGLELARGLEAIHAAGIVHRDLKPSNLLLSPDGKAKIADFGIALDAFQNGLTQPGMTLGSFPYMSPEQLRGERVDARSDLYNLGLVLFEMLTGTPAFSVDVGEGAADNLLKKIGTDSGQLDARMSGAPRWLRRVVRRCLELHAKDRYASALELREELEDRIADPSPSLTHARVGAFLDRAGLISADDATQRIPAVAARTRRWKPKAWHVLPVLGALVVGLPWIALDSGWLPAGLGRGATPELIREPATESPMGVAAAGIEDPDLNARSAGESGALIPLAMMPRLAQLHVVVEPWASVAIEGHESYWTPRQRPTELAPGRYTVTLSHPKLGSVSYEVDLKDGEHVWLRHRFEEAAP